MATAHPALACFTFDNMGEAADVGAGTVPGISATPHPSLAVGYPRLFRLLERCDIGASFFVEGWNGEHNPDAVAEVVKRGHELGMHGWTHEQWHELDAAQEAILATRATDALEGAAGVRPRGFRAPGGQRSAATENVLCDLGYRYDASLGNGMKAGVLESGLAQVPFVWPAVDGFYYLRPQPVSEDEVRETWLRTLDVVASKGGLFLLICHAFITGTSTRRLAALEAVMRAANADPRVRVVTAGDAAAEVLRTET